MTTFVVMEFPDQWQDWGKIFAKLFNLYHIFLMLALLWTYKHQCKCSD